MTESEVMNEIIEDLLSGAKKQHQRGEMQPTCVLVLKTATEKYATAFLAGAEVFFETEERRRDHLPGFIKAVAEEFKKEGDGLVAIITILGVWMDLYWHPKGQNTPVDLPKSPHAQKVLLIKVDTIDKIRVSFVPYESVGGRIVYDEAMCLEDNDILGFNDIPENLFPKDL